MPNNELPLEDFREQLLLREALVDIETLLPLPDNPKLHATGYLTKLMGHYGFITRPIINEPTLHILAGNGRIENLREMKKVDEEPPTGVVVKSGRWYILIDYANVPVDEEIPLALALNRAEEMGGWDQEMLGKAFAKTPEDSRELVGWDREFVRALSAFHAPADKDPEEWEERVQSAVSRAKPAPDLPVNPAPDEDGNGADVEEDGRPDLSVVRYVVETATARLVMKAVREAKKAEGLIETSDALRVVCECYLEKIGVMDE